VQNAFLLLLKSALAPFRVSVSLLHPSFRKVEVGMKRPRYLSAFDWEWSDEYPSESARDQAILNRRRHTRQLARLCEGHSLVHFALWEKLPKGHPIGELWMETSTDLGASVYLAYGGYFRQALAILRLWLELSANGLYFAQHYSQPTSRYRKWRAGERQAPTNMQAIAQSLAADSKAQTGADAIAIRQILEPLYAELCHHVHGQGLDVYDLQNGRDNVPRFLEQSFDLWWKCAFRVLDATCYLYRLFYTKELGAYLSISKSEKRRALSLAKVLQPNAPEFALLIATAIKTSGE
jgi:hypothetical protein